MRIVHSRGVENSDTITITCPSTAAAAAATDGGLCGSNESEEFSLSLSLFLPFRAARLVELAMLASVQVPATIPASQPAKQATRGRQNRTMTEAERSVLTFCACANESQQVNQIIS